MFVERVRKLCEARSCEDIYTSTTLALNAQVVVELGTGSGVSANAFLKGLHETGGVLYSVDNYLYPEVKDTVKSLKEETGFNFIYGDSVEVGKAWDKGDLDILLCDSDHTESHVLNELETWLHHHPKIVFIHDLVQPDMSLAPPYYACDKYAKAHNKLFVALLKKYPGLGIIVDEERQLSCLLETKDLDISPTRRQVMLWLERHGKDVAGNILHAGSGEDYYNYKRFFPNHDRYLNLDKVQQKNVDIIADIQNMPAIPTESQDCVLTIFVLYQVPNVEAALNEVYRVLKPGGVIFATFPSIGWPLETDSFDRRFTAEEVRDLLRAFKVEDVFECLNQDKEVAEYLVKGRK